jgi:hypothetical protein
MMLAQQEPWIGPPVPVLRIDADDTLLDLLARDPEPLATDHKFYVRYPRFPYNDLPFRPYEVRRVHDEERRGREEAERLEEEASRARAERLREERREQARLSEAERIAAQIEHREHRKVEWLAMMEAAAATVRGTRHEAKMLPDLERDMATIAKWSTDEDPSFWLDKDRFEAAFARRLMEAEKHE